MADTKKEHFVPRCYLKHFVSETERINVFDKVTLGKRNQKILDVAMENYFYDIDFYKLLDSVPSDKIDEVKQDLMKIVDTDCWEEVEAALDKKHLEKEYFSRMEATYSKLLEEIIRKAYGGNAWVIDHCKALSSEEKVSLSLFIAIQIIRTKSFRENIKNITEKLYQQIAYILQAQEENAVSKDEIRVTANDDYVKLEHSSMILNEEMAIDVAKTLLNHIWVMYVNKTDVPFYTSDNPVALIPHKHDKYMSYAGLKSEGIEIAFPVSPDLLIGIYDEEVYKDLFVDRQFLRLDSPQDAEYFNRAQVFSSLRCVFSNKDDFDLAAAICEEYPSIRDYKDRFTE